MEKICAKYKFFCEGNYIDIENAVNGFLSKIDVRQIIKIETTVDKSYNFCAITYISFEDIRDLKIQTLIN